MPPFILIGEILLLDLSFINTLLNYCLSLYMSKNIISQTNVIFNYMTIQKWTYGTVAGAGILYRKSTNPTVRTLTILVGGGGFEPPKSETSDLQSDAFGHSAIRPY